MVIRGAQIHVAYTWVHAQLIYLVHIRACHMLAWTAKQSGKKGERDKADTVVCHGLATPHHML